MSLGVQHDDQPPGGVSADGLDPEGGAERGERALMVICGIQIGPETDVLGVIIGLDPDRRGDHGGIVESLCDSSKAVSWVRYACSSGLSRIASRISVMAPSRSPFAWSAALRASCDQA